MKRSYIIPVLVLGLSLLAAGAQARTPYQPDEEPRACTMQYDPVCGAKQVQCIKAPCYPQYQTYGNACTLGLDDDATFIHAGECTAAETGPVKPTGAYVPPAHCSAWFDGCNQCGRGSNGESFCTLMACEGDPSPGYCIRYDSAPAEQPAPAPTPTGPVDTEPVSIIEEVAPAEPLGFFEALIERIRLFFAQF